MPTYSFPWQYDLFFAFIFILLPLGLWKVVDIIVYFFKHIRWKP